MRERVRQVIHEARVEPRDDAWMRGFDRTFSRQLGRRGLLGMTLPAAMGGGAGFLERHVITEELLRAGAPCAAHWLADRQIGPVIATYGSKRLQEELLPGIRDGTLVCSVAISEPEAGSDVAAISLTATPVEGGWRLHGRKLWTTLAHEADLVYVVARTSSDGDRHEGLSEFVVPTSTPGLEVRPIRDMAGQEHFNELLFDGVEVPQWRLVGEVGGAWSQVMAQLNLERSGPERVLSTYPTFTHLSRWVNERGDWEDRRLLGRLAARGAALRAMSWRVAEALDAGRTVDASASMVKDLGGRYEQEVIEVALEVTGLTPARAEGPDATLRAALADGLRAAPAFTLRGGSSEVLAELISRRGLQLGRRLPSQPALVARMSELATLEASARQAFEADADDSWRVARDLGLFELAAPELEGGARVRREAIAAVLRAQGAAARSNPLLGQLMTAVVLRNGGWSPARVEEVSAATVVVTHVDDCANELRLRSVSFGRDARWALVLRSSPYLLDLTDMTVHAGEDLSGAPLDELVVPSGAPRTPLQITPSALEEVIEVLAPIGKAAAVAGACRRALDDALEHAHDREQFGRPLRSFQAVAHRLARAAAACELLDVAVEVAARSGDRYSVACAQIEAVQVAREVTAHAHQVLGAIGITTEHSLHRATLRARAWSLNGSRRSVEEVLGTAVARDVDAWWDATSEALAS